MKDEFYQVTAEILQLAPMLAKDCPPAAAARTDSPQAKQAKLKPKKKSAPREFKQLDPVSSVPDGAKWFYGHGGVVNLVPVSFVAKDWKVTSRRIRFLLDAGRLQGRRQDNGYWEVFYPYRVIDGLRGPALRRHKKAERRTE